MHFLATWGHLSRASHHSERLLLVFYETVTDGLSFDVGPQLLYFQLG